MNFNFLSVNKFVYLSVCLSVSLSSSLFLIPSTYVPILNLLFPSLFLFFFFFFFFSLFLASLLFILPVSLSSCLSLCLLSRLPISPSQLPPKPLFHPPTQTHPSPFFFFTPLSTELIFSYKNASRKSTEVTQTHHVNVTCILCLNSSCGGFS